MITLEKFPLKVRYIFHAWYSWCWCLMLMLHLVETIYLLRVQVLVQVVVLVQVLVLAQVVVFVHVVVVVHSSLLRCLETQLPLREAPFRLARFNLGIARLGGGV